MNEISITSKELKILDHMLGGSKKYRNYFYANKGHDDLNTLKSLEDKGLVTSQINTLPNNFIFNVTEDGIKLFDELSGIVT